MTPAPEFTSAADLRAHYAGVRSRLIEATVRHAALPARRPYAPAPIPRPVAHIGPVWPSMAEPQDDGTIVIPSFLSRYRAVHKPHMPITSAERWKIIMREVAAEHGLTTNDIRRAGRQNVIVVARNHYCSRCYRETTMSLTQIGHTLGKDHTTVLHGIRKHEQRMRGAA